MRKAIILLILLLLTSCIPSIEKTEVQSSREEIVIKDDNNLSMGSIDVFKFTYDGHRWIYFEKVFYSSDTRDFEIKHDPECPRCYELRQIPEE